MRELNEHRVCELLNEIIELEMAGVVRYAHSSLMITGPNRIPIVAFLQEQATEVYNMPYRLESISQALADTLHKGLHI